MKKRFCTVLALFMFVMALFPVSALAASSDYSTTFTCPIENVFTGTPNKIPDFQYTITAVTANAPMPKDTQATISGSGKSSFGPITFTMPGNYEYRISQTKGTAENVTYDTAFYKLTVIVTNDSNGGLASQAKIQKNAVGSKDVQVLFTNSYAAPVVPSSVPTPVTSVAVTEPAKPAVTSDSSHTGLLAAVACISAACLVVLCAKRKKVQ
ncbi:MAG: hypothetical protein LKE53_05185 [Oscillospiraceae bacterium]|nr:hypothetical protein [Oscillospiraceae bacterium]MDD3261661.1 FctA domain-containing protein [Oscillospiraceae bacterium]